MNHVRARFALVPRLAWAALLLPAAVAAWTVHEVALAYAPIPFNDYWATIGQYQDVLRHGLTLSDLFAQHNEHRILFPRLVFFADLAWFNGRGLLDYAAIAAIQLLGAAFYLAVAKMRPLRPLGILGLAVATALMFGLVQWENFFWAFQVQFVGVYVAGAWAIYFFCRGTAADPPRWEQVLAGLALVGVATFNMANGALAGAAMAMTALIARRSPAAAAAAALATVAFLAIYLFGYHGDGDHTANALALRHPLWIVIYVLTYLGNVWAMGHGKLAFVIGGAGVLGAMAMTLLVFRDRGRDPARMALLGVVLFVGLSAGLTSLGRLAFGIGYALSSRYVTPTSHFWAAQALFWALTFQDARAPWLKRAGAAALIICAALFAPMETFAARQLQAPRERILLGGSALLSGAPDAEAVKGVYPTADVPLAYAPLLRVQHLALFAGQEAPRVGETFAPPGFAGPASCRGFFDWLFPEPKAPGAWRASGWSWNEAQRRPFDRIVLVDDTGAVVGDALSGTRRKDVPKAMRQVTTPESGWIGAVVRGHGRQVVAYALLPDGQACELGRKDWPA